MQEVEVVIVDDNNQVVEKLKPEGIEEDKDNKKNRKRNMFGVCMKNYVSMLRYVFTVLGVLFITLIIGATIFFQTFSKAMSELGEDVKEVTSNADLSLDGLGTALWEDLTSSGDYVEAYNDIDSNNDKFVSIDETHTAVTSSFENVLNHKIENYSNYASKVGECILEAIEKMMKALFVALIWQAIGVIISITVVNFYARMDVERRNPLRVILSALFHDLIFVLSIVVTVVLISVVSDYSIIVIALYPLFFCMLSLLDSNISMGKEKRVRIRELFTLGNILTLLFCNILGIAISAIIAVVILSLGNIVIAFYVGIALVVVTGLSTAVNADAMVYKLSEEKRN